MKYSESEIRQYVAEEDVKFLRMTFFDLTGNQKNMSILPDALDRAFSAGIAFDASAIPGFGDELRSDIVKVNHHGYDTSSGKQFIDTLQPILTVSQHESVTSKTVALRFYTSGAQVFYTCMDGTVRVRTSGDGQYDVQSQKIREQTYYGEPAADGHYTVSRAAEQ